MIIKCFALWQPWATLVVEGLKKFETRSQYSKHRGLTGILATKNSPPWAEELFYSPTFHSVLKQLGYEKFDDLPKGGVIGTVQVEKWLKIIENNRKPIHPMVETNITGNSREREFGDWKAGRYAIELSNPEKFDLKFAVNGQQGLLFNIDVPEHFGVIITAK